VVEVRGVKLTLNGFSEIEISVTDKGMGICEADRARLF
jgi:signal transduction histidine kinase